MTGSLPPTSPGASLPLGATIAGSGTNFALFSRHARAVELLLFDAPGDRRPRWRIDLDPEHHRSGDIWHIRVEGVGAGVGYAWRVDGPWEPGAGLRFNRHRLLVDPMAVAMSGVSGWDFAAASSDAAANDNMASAARGVVVDNDDFDWGDDRPLQRPWSQIVIYETHVRGLTIDAAAKVGAPGTYAGLVEKIPYLLDLGITAVELLPVQEFNEHEVGFTAPHSDVALRNYWGYNPVGFISPKAGYAAAGDAGDVVTEFRHMVRALHAAGIEVYLDVVFNHTAEGNQRGPTLHLRGIDNRIYYLLADDRSDYRDFTGCGNTLDCNHPVVREFILDCLRYWVLAMHVDGFRFDLAAVLGRDEHGNVLANAPLLERLAEDPVLRHTKLIAEAWDAGGAYELGHFAGQRWSEWNGRYRDDVRRFWRGDPGMTGALASRLAGSADLFKKGGKSPLNSINFITCHDGFTLNDLVSYARKHNADNGEDGCDGADANFSDNMGAEGASDDPAINAARLRRMRSLLATLMLSRGVPMLCGGDEMARTQCGNNNAWCQDNGISWYDWRRLDTYAGLHDFTRRAIALRRRFPVLAEERFYTDADVTWFAADGGGVDWDGPAARLGVHLHPTDADVDAELCVLFNAGKAVTFWLPPPRSVSGDWRVELDSDPHGAVADADGGWRLAPDSLLVLAAG